MKVSTFRHYSACIEVVRLERGLFPRATEGKSTEKRNTELETQLQAGEHKGKKDKIRKAEHDNT